MKALVLTYDNNRAYTRHMIMRYRTLWPDHPFTFVIPGQNPDLPLPPDSVWIPAAPDITSTINVLLAQADPEEWIYWAIDDKYPISINTRSLQFIHRHLVSNPSVECDSLLFCKRGPIRYRHLLKKPCFTLDGKIALFRQFAHEGFWNHRFLRPKILDAMFSRFDDVIPNAKIMDEWLHKLPPCSDQRLYFTRVQMGVFGESTTRGKATRNCAQSMRRMNIDHSAGDTGTSITFPRFPIDFQLGKILCRPKS